MGNHACEESSEGKSTPTGEDPRRHRFRPAAEKAGDGHGANNLPVRRMDA